jgi:hypothetical protein
MMNALRRARRAFRFKALSAVKINRDMAIRMRLQAATHFRRDMRDMPDTQGFSSFPRHA